MTPPPFRAAPAATVEAVHALAPSGTLRAGINLSNFLLVTGAAPSGEPAGVSPSMAAAVAAALGVPVELLTYPSPGELADAVAAWDIGNIGADPARAEHIAFTAPYSEIESTYVVRRESPISRIDDVDRPGIRIVSKARAAYTLWLERHLDDADLVLTDSADESAKRFADGDADVLAGLRPRLVSDVTRLGGCRILEGRFTAVQQAIGTPRDRPPAGIAFLEEFVAASVASGFVAALIDRHGAVGLTVPQP